MRILVCDDEIREVEDIMKRCKEYLASRDMEAEVEGTTDPGQIRENDIDILVLDIEMPEANGIDIKDQLAKEGRKPLIIFATNYADAMSRAFNTNVIGFLVKPVRLDELTIFMDTAMEQLAMDKRIYFDDGTSASTRDIVWLTANKGYSDFLLADGTTKDGGKKSIKVWEADLEAYGFIRTSNGRLVNCGYIKEYLEEELLMSDVKISHGSDVSTLKTEVSVRRRKECKEKYLTYCSKVGKYI